MPAFVEDVLSYCVLAALLLAAFGVARAVLGTCKSAFLPDFLVFIAAGLAARTLVSEWMEPAALKSTLTPVQAVALFLLITPSCAGLHFGRIGRHALEVACLVTGSVAAFLLALITVPLLHGLTPDPAFAQAEGNALAGHFLVLSLGVMVTSLPFLTKILIDTGLLRTAFGNSLLLSACLVDILVWILFSLAVSVYSGGRADISAAALHFGTALVLICAAFAAGLGLARLFAAAMPVGGRADLALILTVSAMLIFGLAALGLAPVVGMVVAGLVIGALHRRLAAGLEHFRRLSNGVGAPVYFICVGLGVDLTATVSLAAICVFFLWSSSLKIGAVAATTGALRQASAGGLDFGIAMNTRGGPGLVLAAAAYSIGLVGITGFAALTFASITTAILTELYLRQAGDRLARVPVAASALAGKDSAGTR